MEPLSVVVIVLLTVALLLMVVRSLRSPGSRPTPPGSWRSDEVDARVVTLDLAVDDPDAPAVRRLVSEVARRALRASPALDEVEVRDRAGVTLGRIARPEPLPPAPAIPDELREPRTARARTPTAVRSEDAGPPTRRLPQPDAEIDLTAPDRPFADRFDLPEAVRRRVRDPERPVELVRAILEAAGRPARIVGGVVVTGDTGITIVAATGRPVADELGEAFIRLRAADVARGVVVRLLYADPEMIRHREAAAPHVRHVTAEAIQRMADAVAAGGDPVEFAVGPALLP